jgi:hypothetical protein
MSKDGITWSPTAFRDENTITATLTDYTIGGLGLDSSYYFKFVAVDSGGSHVSDTSDTYGVRTGPKNRYLIVDGFDRYGGSGSWQKPQHDFVRYYGDALAGSGKTFDAAANEAVAAGNISLNNYSGVIWFVGDESSANRTFNSTEQNVVKAYLEGGGKLFVTGSEIAYELIGSSTADPNDKLFFTNYFKATWGGDKADGSTVSGVSGNIFAGIAATFGQTYPEDYPDYFVPAGGAVTCLLYAPAQVAGLNYSGTFGSSTKIGVLVYFGFPFETIASLTQRTSLMGAIVHYFETFTGVIEEVNSSPGRFSLGQNFPNPFNPVTHIQFAIAHDEFVSLKIYDVLGKEVATLVDEQRSAGTYSVRWDASNFTSGVYFYKLGAGDFVEAKKLMLMK